MAVKRSQSAARVLAALEGVAQHQPVGVSALARILGADKSATQRALMTLADAGWIRAVPDNSARWELTPHILTIAHVPHSVQDLRARAHGTLERLRTETGETVYLIVPDRDAFVIVEALESRQLLRMSAPIGMAVPVRGSGTGLVILPFLSPERQAELLGGPPDAAMRAAFEETRARGYGVSDGHIERTAVSISAPIIERGAPVGAIVVAGPNDRIDAQDRERIGRLIAAAAAALSSPPSSPLSSLARQGG